MRAKIRKKRYLIATILLAVIVVIFAVGSGVDTNGLLGLLPLGIVGLAMVLIVFFVQRALKNAAKTIIRVFAGFFGGAAIMGILNYCGVPEVIALIIGIVLGIVIGIFAPKIKRKRGRRR